MMPMNVAHRLIDSVSWSEDSPEECRFVWFGSKSNLLRNWKNRHIIPFHLSCFTQVVLVIKVDIIEWVYLFCSPSKCIRHLDTHVQFCHYYLELFKFAVFHMFTYLFDVHFNSMLTFIYSFIDFLINFLGTGACFNCSCLRRKQTDYHHINGNNELTA